MLKKVLLVGDKLLKTPCPVYSLDKINELLAVSCGGSGYTLEEFLRDMFQTMVAENGMGLASNQIGWLLKIFILKDVGVRGYNEYINPEVLSQEELVDFEDEGCLSIPGIKAATKRYRKLRLRWQDREGTTYESDFENLQAFAIQHEMDHLNGKLYVDQFNRALRQMILKRHKKYLRSLGRR